MIQAQRWSCWLLFVAIAQAGCGSDPDAADSDAQSMTADSSGAAGTGAATPVMTTAAAGRAAPAGAAGIQTPVVGPSTPAAGSGGVSASASGDVAAAGSGGSAAGASAAAGGGAAGAGAGAAGMGAAGAGAATTSGADDCGADAKEVMGGMPRGGDNGNTNLQTSGEVEFLEARSTLTVPSKPAPERGTLFLWPGLQPLRSDNEIGYGVLQPVLTWGSSCAPGTLSESDGWWISGQYVGTPPGSFRVICKGGDVMKVDIGDKLDIVFKLEGTMWKQTVTNQKNGKSVEFAIDMKGQKQQWLLHQIEQPTTVKPVDDVIFTNVVAKLSDSQPMSCYPNAKGTNDYFAPPKASADGKTCCISKIILRASGVKASSPDTP